VKRFQAKVVSSSGQIDFVEVEAENDIEARKFVELSGQHLLGLKDVGGGQFRRQSKKAFNLPVFNQQLLSLLEAGQTVVDSIEVLGKNDKRGQYRATFDTLLHALREGNQLSEAMAKLPSTFPSLYVAMVKSSETTGSIKASIKRFMQYQSQVNEIRNKLVAAATYPAILLGVGFLVVSFLMFYVLPRFSAIYEDTMSSQAAKHGFVQWWGKLVREHTFSLLSVLVILVSAVMIVATHPKTRAWLANKVLQTPWIGERVWLLQLARMYRTMGMLLKSGVSVIAAMTMTKASLPVQMHENMESAIRDVSEGKPFSESFSTHGLSTEIAQRLLVAGESSGNLDEMMERIADFYDQETSIWIDTAGRFIEPVLMVSIGLIIGLIVLMLYSPIFELANIA
jgi:general secretion pathway protein F